MQKYDKVIDTIGFEEMGRMIEEGDPNKMVKTVREAIFK